MKIITHKEIQSLNLSPVQFMEWVETVIREKERSIIPPKVKIYMTNNISRFTTMPCYIPSINRMGVKIGASRFPGQEPAIDTSIIIYDSNTGEMLGILDAHIITSMRTGAVAALSIKKLKTNKSPCELGIMGLGATSTSMLLCLLESSQDDFFYIKLLRYKNQAQLFIERFKKYSNVSFNIVDTHKDLIYGSDVIVSAITVAQGQIGENEWFKEGCTLIPIHTRGFENCDLFFDKIFGDVTEQISIFKNFLKFKAFNEFTKVLNNECEGRINDKERILVYNIGMGLHDIYIGSKVLELANTLLDVADVNFKVQLPKSFI
jgi:ornithine cyclodeaminase/alanine dehydrogenase-like protein (mu-crystallin family)